MVSVSVILPVYNEDKYLMQAVNSVLEQSYQDFELIIVDDGSSSNTKKMLYSLEKEPVINLITLSKNRGVAGARNAGIKAAQGEYIAFIDSDDVWTTDKLKEQVRFMKMNKYSFTYSYYNIIDGCGNVVDSIDFLPKKIDYKILRHSNFIPLLTVIIKKDLLENNLFLDIHHEDYVAWLLILKDCEVKAYLFQNVGASYRVHGKSVSSNKLKSLIWSWNIYRSVLKLSFIKSFYFIVTNAFWGFVKHRHSLKQLFGGKRE